MLILISLAVGYATITGGAFGSRSKAFAAPITGLSYPGVSSSVPATDQSVLRPPTINRTIRAQQVVPSPQLEAAAQIAAAAATPTAQPPEVPAVPEDAIVRAASVAPPPEQPLYHVYQVQEGDTVDSIAARSGVKAEYILANNADIVDSDFLKLGQSIIVPASDGVLHEVRLGETLSDIAAKYDVDVSAITSFAGNHITTPDDIRETQSLFVPNATIPRAVALPAPTPTDDPSSDSTPVPSSSGGGIVSGGPKSDHGLIWPVVGPVSSYYGPSHPLGIDIDGYNLVGSPVGAATSGTVIFAGGNACCSYGLYVVVMSPGGIETLYAHLSSISVVQGETVDQGEELGIIGSTGYSTGTHLHFEVIDNGVRVNPLSYLP